MKGSEIKMAKEKDIPRNDDQYKQLASEYIIQGNKQLDAIAINAHKLYDATLYIIRPGFCGKTKNAQTHYSYAQLNSIFKKRCQNRQSMLYHGLGYVQSAQQTIKEVCTIWDAWFKALKAYKVNPHKFTGKPRIPNYPRTSKKHTFYVTNQNAKIKNGYLVIPKLNIKLKLKPGVKKIGRIAFKPLARGKYKVVIPVRQEKEIKYLPDNGIYVGVDPGVDNAFVCTTNANKRPLIINGHGLKSVNQYYNKRIAYLKSKQAEYHQLEFFINTKHGKQPCYYRTQRMNKCDEYRNNKVYQFAHKASKRIVDYALSCGANTIVIGKNKNWKRHSNMGKRNNQNFIGIPHAIMINMIRYKANQYGISVVTTNESYTSQTSFLDHEKPCYDNGNKAREKKGLLPAIRRIKRGLFKSNNGTLINSDVNGALQIIKKAFPNSSFDDGIEGVVLHPVKWSPLI